MSTPEEKAEEFCREMRVDPDICLGDSFYLDPEGHVITPRRCFMAGYAAGLKAGEEHLSTWSRKVTSELIADAMRPKKEGG